MTPNTKPIDASLEKKLKYKYKKADVSLPFENSEKVLTMKQSFSLRNSTAYAGSVAVAKEPA